MIYLVTAQLPVINPELGKHSVGWVHNIKRDFCGDLDIFCRNIVIPYEIWHRTSHLPKFRFNPLRYFSARTVSFIVVFILIMRAVFSIDPIFHVILEVATQLKGSTSASMCTSTLCRLWRPIFANRSCSISCVKCVRKCTRLASVTKWQLPLNPLCLIKIRIYIHQTQRKISKNGG